MSSAKKIVVAVVVVIVIAALAFAWYAMSHRGVSVPSAGTTGAPSGNTTIATSTTRTAVPTNVVVPDKGAATSSVPTGVAVPVVQGAGDPSGNVSYRSFNITIQNGVYNPDTVIVNQGDTVNLELTAADAAYGFTQPDYGFDAAIPEGKTQTIQFQALQSGNFTFYCSSCGGPSKGPVGHIIVVAK